MWKVILRLLANLATAALGAISVVLANPETFTEFGAFAAIAAAIGAIISNLIGKIKIPEPE